MNVLIGLKRIVPPKVMSSANHAGQLCEPVMQCAIQLTFLHTVVKFLKSRVQGDSGGIEPFAEKVVIESLLISVDREVEVSSVLLTRAHSHIVQLGCQTIGVFCHRGIGIVPRMGFDTVQSE